MDFRGLPFVMTMILRNIDDFPRSAPPTKSNKRFRADVFATFDSRGRTWKSIDITEHHGRDL